MTKTGWHSDEEHEEEQTASNVVRFPRDWFGPPEELVQIGSWAESDTSAPEPPLVASSGDGPPTAAEFWGAGSAAIQEPLVEQAQPWGDSARSRRWLFRTPRLDRFTRSARVALPLGALLAIAVAGYVFGGPTASNQPATRLADRSERGSGSALDFSVDLQPLVHFKLPHETRREPLHSSSHLSASSSSPAQEAAATSQVTGVPVSDVTGTSQSVSSAQRGDGEASSRSPQPQASTASDASAPVGPVGPGAAFGPGEMK